jgi:thiamine transporter ThiT
MKTWYNNLTAKQFRIIYTTLWLLPITTSLVLSFLEIGKWFRDNSVAFMFIPIFFVMIRRKTHPAEYPKIHWSVNYIAVVGMVLATVALILRNRN